MNKSRKLLAGATAAVALVIAGCGGGGGYGSSAPSAAGAGKPATGAPVNVVTDPKLGKIIVDAKGRTLYDFVIDKGTMSVCNGACASLWPPYLTKGAPTGPGVAR